MTRFEPTLIVERMRIDRDDVPVYDENFHDGVNVVRGENSSGKSTVLNFVFYGLGGDLFDWSAAAQRCSRVMVQVRINGKVATFSRLVSDKSKQPMDIFAGEIHAALSAPASEWLRFGYSRSESKESFSQVIFRLMNMPEVVNDISGNITANQLLRLLYADQLSPVESLFKYQGAFDDANLRDAVGRLLFGAHSAQFYENVQEIRRLNKELDQLTGEYRSLISAAGVVSEGFTYEWVATQRRTIEGEMARIVARIEELERAIATGEGKVTFSLDAQNAAYQEVVLLQSLVGDLQQRRDSLSLKIADSDRFLESLAAKLVALQDSSAVADVIGDARFNECPACHAPTDDPVSHSCYLCKTPYDRGDERGRITALINETALQIGQSEALQRDRQKQAQVLDEELELALQRWRMASEKLASTQRSVQTDDQRELQELNRQAGYLRV